MVLSVVALFIACLGLFGLISFTASQHTREIGIRKVMGAGILKLLALQLREIVLLILASSVLAWILVYFLADSWLKDYSYRIPLSPYYFFLAMIIVLIIAVFTVIRKTYLAANTNPGQAIRYE
jgi:putative ABC transport system permease protein